MSQGAISINMPESSIKVSEAEDEILIEVFEDSPSRQMVAEMMILAGEVAARYGQEHACCHSVSQPTSARASLG
jgi:exoribonuclease-2